MLLNIGAYIAERMRSDLILFPSTVLSMADGAGGKVRANAFIEGLPYKHYYKSFYEPDAMYLEPRFLETLPERQKRNGLVEIIKHSLFQSDPLYDYLRDKGNSLLSDDNKMLKAILWAADLKRVCIEVDVEENDNGSRQILRAGHDVSDRLEERENLQIPHGFAVAIGIIEMLKFERDGERLEKANELFSLFGIPKSLEEYNSLNQR